MASAVALMTRRRARNADLSGNMLPESLKRVR
jgi:hypothetical protein